MIMESAENVAALRAYRGDPIARIRQLEAALRDLLADVELARDGDSILDGSMKPAHLYAARLALAPAPGGKVGEEEPK